jgi:N-acetylglutamate synthase-like GNAT family acetyltransferase
MMPRKKKPKPAREPANDREPAQKKAKKAAPPPKPPNPQPKPKLREAKPSDARRLVELINYLGHEIDEKTVRKNLSALKNSGETPLVATLDKNVVGLCGIHKTVTVHRDAPLGRLTILVVAEDAQGHGVGRMLVDEAERLLKKAGCKIVEVTSNDRRTAAHAFYRHMGYERTSLRFMKKL